MEKRNKCYIYMRVSTAAQIDGYSLDAQKERLTEFAEYRELTIAGEYCDAGRSGHDVKGRPEFRKMLDDIASEKDGISYVLVFKLSRFGRNAADVLRSLQLIQDYGADLVSVEEGIDSSTQGGKLMLSLLSAVAEIERENINVQFLSGRIQKIREGGWGGGTAPFGYRLTDQGLVPDPEEAGMVRTMYSIFLREGAGWSTAAREMNDMGLSRTYRGRTVPFTASFVKVIILNPVNAGYVHFGLRSDRRDTIIAKGSHEALIPEETWQQAKAKAAEEAKAKAETAAAKAKVPFGIPPAAAAAFAGKPGGFAPPAAAGAALKTPAAGGGIFFNDEEEKKSPFDGLKLGGDSPNLPSLDLSGLADDPDVFEPEEAADE